MKAAELLSVLDLLDRKHRTWLIPLDMLRVLFPDESKASLNMSIRRHIRLGLITRVARGLYANERAHCSRVERLPALVPYLKPDDINYISQESRLFDLGLILQAPLSLLTVMTSGTSASFRTPYGKVRFTHSARPIDFILSHTQKDPESGLLVADATLAKKDLARAGRRMDLVHEAEEAFG